MAIYPITPASPMGELGDAWAQAGRTNLWGTVPEVVEMQSEAGAAGALHGALQAGALGCTFTASQGLLLMLPNLYKIAGELTPTVVHVAARTVATHALSIFGDHSDVMAARSTGCAMLCAGSVQEAHDLALIAHAASLRSRLPFLHFFDGFRTSHEVATIDAIPDAVVREMIDDELGGRSPAPFSRPQPAGGPGTAQNPDVFFQAREAANPWYDATPGIVATEMDRLGELTGRHYGLFDYVGDPEAERVLVLMGSGAGAAGEAVERLTSAGERVGLLTVRLYRPFAVDAFSAVLPASPAPSPSSTAPRNPEQSATPFTSTSSPLWPRPGEGTSPPPGCDTGCPPRSSPRQWRKPFSAIWLTPLLAAMPPWASTTTSRALR